jgi:hypothetical protein
MSRASQQLTLGDLPQDDEAEQPAEGTRERQQAAAWTPVESGRDNESCDNCGAHVNPDTARALRDQDGDINGCFGCADAYPEVWVMVNGVERHYEPGRAGGGGI